MLSNEAAYQSILNRVFTAALRGNAVINTGSVSAATTWTRGSVAPAAASSRCPSAAAACPPSRASGRRARRRPQRRAARGAAAARHHQGDRVLRRHRHGAAHQVCYESRPHHHDAGLAESMHLTRTQGLDVEAYGRVLEASPMALAYSKLTVAKMIAEDWSSQAAIADCYDLTELVQHAAADVGAQTPLMTVCNALHKEAVGRGFGGDDMIVIHKVMTPPRVSEEDGEK